jgi:6-pyruvoyltetrahydropterin/6-carboxytetrahydropterin synthase
MYEQSYSFTFEAAHELAANVAAAPGHAYSRVHGHSFAVTLTLRAESLGDKGWIVDFAELRALAEAVKAALDHRLLNEIKGLERPTLENIARWIFERVAEKAPAIARVDVARPSLNERVGYSSGR